MIKRSLLAASIAVALVQQAAAAPLLPINARGLAMGSTGVASAKMAHAPQYNPALLSTANDTDEFSIIFPQLGIVVYDKDKLIE
jgi:long-subunit fatty acid transport protein